MDDPGSVSTGNKLETLLPRFSLERRITVLVMLLTALVLGVVAITAIPIELIPSGFSEPFLRVYAPWQDAPPQEVLDKITLPLEEELSTVRGLENMFSFARTGFGQVFLSFKHGTDMDIAYREVRDRVERARTRMPDDLQQVFIGKDDDQSFPVAMVGLTVPPDITDFYNLIEYEIVRPLERLDGVATVVANGLIEKEVLIEVDRQRAEAAGLNIFEVAQDLSKDNFTMASGNVRSGDRKLLLRSVARYRDTQSVGDIMLAPTVRLGDIAAIKYEEPEKNFSVRVNSQPAYALMVMKEGEANTLEVARRVSELVESLANNPRLKGVDAAMIMDQGEIIMSSLSILLDSGRVGAVLAMVVLMFFLRRFRLSLIIALSIPLSMVVAIVVMYFAGETLNVLTLLGLMISVGLLVDNSVVVAENIHRIYRDTDLDRKSAALHGAGQIALAVTTATLTTIVVFLPVALVEGQGQFFLMRLALPISVSLLASLLVALIAVPLAVYLTLPRREVEESDSWSHRAHLRMNRTLKRAYELSFGALGRFYNHVLDLALRRRLETVLVLIGILAVTQLAAKQWIEVVAMSEDDQSFFEIDVELPRSMSFDEAHRWFLRAEEEVAELAPDLGLEFYILEHSTRRGSIQAMVDTKRDNPLNPREMAESILENLPELPGGEFHTGRSSEQDTGDRALESLLLFGEDSRVLEELAEDLEDTFGRLPGVLGVKSSGDPPPNELALTIDREKAQSQQIDPQMVAGTVGYALRGQALPRIYFGGRDIPVRVRYEEADRTGLDQLVSFPVPTGSGETVSLSTFVEARQLPAATGIWRRDKRTARRITLELEEGREEEGRKAIRAMVARIDLPEGVSFGAPMRRTQDEAANLQFAALLSTVFVYLLMGFLFESFLLPLAILVTIPLAVVGVMWSHILTGRQLDFLGLVGFIILIGVVVNNGIVLLDYVRRLRSDGIGRHEALLLATERRFRPIMMTALTTICGMVPLVLGEPTRMGLSYKSFGLTLIGGMVTSGLMTLLVVPVFYTLFEDARSIVGRGILAAFGHRGVSEPKAPVASLDGSSGEPEGIAG